MRPTFRSAGGLLRIVATFALASGLADCTVSERPERGPPPIKFQQVGGLGEAPVKGKELVRFAFLTVTGVPAEMRFALEASLKSYAATRNLAISVEDDPTATYRIKGYLSAVGDANGTLLVYTWDVYDAAGVERHRFSGQQTAGGSAVDPWVGVGTGQIDAAARETIDDLADWVRG